MDIKIRNATIDDYEEINKIAVQEQDLHVKLRPDLYKHSDTVILIDWFRELLNDDYIIVGESGKKIVSFAIYYIKNWNDPLIVSKKVLFVKTIANDSNYIGLGVGEQMMNHIKKMGDDMNCDSIELQVNSLNKKAINFYSHMKMNEKSIVMELDLKNR